MLREYKELSNPFENGSADTMGYQSQILDNVGDKLHKKINL